MVLSRSAPFPEQQAQLGWNQLCLALKTSQGILGHKLPYRSGVAAHSSPLPQPCVHTGHWLPPPQHPSASGDPPSGFWLSICSPGWALFCRMATLVVCQVLPNLDFFVLLDKMPQTSLCTNISLQKLFLKRIYSSCFA